MNEYVIKRVKCANCGMVYDVKGYGLMMGPVSGTCPNCKSNAYDVIKSEGREWRHYE